MEPSCPTPWKLHWSSRKHLKDYVRTRGMKGYEPYECPCGRWHLRNRRKNRQGRLRVAAEDAVSLHRSHQDALPSLGMAQTSSETAEGP